MADDRRHPLRGDDRRGDDGIGRRRARRRAGTPRPRSAPDEQLCAARPSRPSVIGIASTIARVTGPQWTTRSSRSAASPSENRVRISASSISSTIASSPDATVTTPAAASTIPTRHREHRDRQHGAAHQPRQRRRDREQGPEDEERVAEAEVHGRAYMRLRLGDAVRRLTCAREWRPTKLADGLVRLGTSYVNWYLVADDDGRHGRRRRRPRLPAAARARASSCSAARSATSGRSSSPTPTAITPASRRPCARRPGAPIHLHPDDAESARNRGKKKIDESLARRARPPGDLPALLALHAERRRASRPCSTARCRSPTATRSRCPGGRGRSTRRATRPGTSPICSPTTAPCSSAT